MHEMGIASSILDAVRKEMAAYPGYRPAKVDVRIGAFAGVDPESLRFCFSAMSRLELVIEEASGDELDLVGIELEEKVTE